MRWIRCHERWVCASWRVEGHHVTAYLRFMQLTASHQWQWPDVLNMLVWIQIYLDPSPATRGAATIFIGCIHGAPHRRPHALHCPLLRIIAWWFLNERQHTIIIAISTLIYRLPSELCYFASLFAVSQLELSMGLREISQSSEKAF